MLSVVADTNFLISAAIRKDSLLRHALDKAITEYGLCLSPATFAELLAVIRRAKFDRYLPLAERIEFANEIKRGAKIFNVDESALPTGHNCRDPKDVKFLALALAAHAGLIISSDADLLTLHPWRGVQILSPTDFLNLHS